MVRGAHAGNRCRLAAIIVFRIRSSLRALSSLTSGGIANADRCSEMCAASATSASPRLSTLPVSRARRGLRSGRAGERGGVDVDLAEAFVAAIAAPGRRR